jgi:UDP-N-acetyl-alpha-D-quinovosamine dehydrogenase
MRVLVTGASGFIGARLVQRLLEERIVVRATHRRKMPDTPGVDWRVVSQLDCAEQWPGLVAGADVVIHLAALAHQLGRTGVGRWPEFLRVNVHGTRLIVRACRTADVRRLVFLSSIAAVCARSQAPVDDRTASVPQEAYGRSKLEAESAFSSQRGPSPIMRRAAGSSTECSE